MTTQNHAQAYLDTLAVGSRATIKNALHTCANILTDGERDAFSMPWHTLQRADVAALMEVLQARYSVATARRMGVALRQVMEIAFAAGDIGEGELNAVTGYSMPWRTGKRKAGRELSGAEIRAIFAALDSETWRESVRNAALVAVMFAGVRRDDVIRLSLDDFDKKNACVYVTNYKTRFAVALNADALARLAAWVSERGREPGPLFPRFSGPRGTRLTMRPMVGPNVSKILTTLADRHSLENFTAFDIHRTAQSRQGFLVPEKYLLQPLETTCGAL